MALTVVEMAKIAENNGETKKAGVLMTFAMGSQLWQRMPIRKIGGNSYAWTREKELSTVASRAVNETYTSSEGKTEQRSQALRLFGGNVDVDRFHVETGGPNQRSIQETMKIKALSQRIGYLTLNGTSVGSGGKDFDGLKTSYVTGGQVLSMSGAALSCEKLDETIELVDPNIGQKVIVMSRALRRRLTSFLRGSSTAIQMTQDAFGNQVHTYGGIPIVEADQNGDLAGLAFDEPASTTSIFIMALGEGAFHFVESQSGLFVHDYGLIQEAPKYRTLVEWYLAPVDEHPRCVARLGGITNAAVVA